MTKLSKILFLLMPAALMLGSCGQTPAASSTSETSKSSSATSEAPISSSQTSEVVSSQEESTSQTSTADGFVVTFQCDQRCSVKVYTTQACTTEDTNETIKTRNGETGEYDNSGDGQVNFQVNVETGYEVTVTATSGAYKNIKGPDSTKADTEVPNVYRITKITQDITVTITSKEIPAAPEAYKVNFALTNCSVTVYTTGTFTTVDTDEQIYTRNGDTGAYAKYDEEAGIKPQVNFVVTPSDGYTVTEECISVSGTYNKIKSQADTIANGWRITVIQTDITITITPVAA